MNDKLICASIIAAKLATTSEIVEVAKSKCAGDSLRQKDFRTLIAKWAVEQVEFIEAEFQSKAISKTPEVMGGKPVLRGTQIPVIQIMYDIADGRSLEEISLDYSVRMSEVQDLVRLVGQQYV